MSEFLHALWTTAVSFAAVAIGVLFIAYLLAAATMPFWLDRKVRK